MVTSSRSGNRLQIVARPDRSSSWRTNMLLLAALAVPSLGAATAFALAGAWPILPLAGIELCALGAALYCVNRKLQFRQVITVNRDTVSIDQGFRGPRQSWRFRRDATGLTITPEQHPWEGPSLLLHDRSDSVPLGDFLGREDLLRLSELLRGEFRVRANSATTRLAF